MTMPIETPRKRSDWGRWLDTLVHPLLGLARWVLPRPSNAHLARLSPRDGGVVNTAPAVRAASHIQKGRTAFERGALGEALHHFGEAIAFDDSARWAWHGRGDALQISERPADALAAYEMACTVDPECGLHHAGRFNALTSLGRIVEADAAWETALRLDSSLTWMRDEGS